MMKSLHNQILDHMKEKGLKVMNKGEIDFNIQNGTVVISYNNGRSKFMNYLYNLKFKMIKAFRGIND